MREVLKVGIFAITMVAVGFIFFPRDKSSNRKSKELAPTFKIGDCIELINTNEFKDILDKGQPRYVYKVVKIGQEKYLVWFDRVGRFNINDPQGVLSTIDISSQEYYQKLDDALCQVKQ